MENAASTTLSAALPIVFVMQPGPLMDLVLQRQAESAVLDFERRGIVDKDAAQIGDYVSTTDLVGGNEEFRVNYDGDIDGEASEYGLPRWRVLPNSRAQWPHRIFYRKPRTTIELLLSGSPLAVGVMEFEAVFDTKTGVVLAWKRVV